jgi:hypothetical protein
VRLHQNGVGKAQQGIGGGEHPDDVIWPRCVRPPTVWHGQESDESSSVRMAPREVPQEQIPWKLTSRCFGSKRPPVRVQLSRPNVLLMSVF